MSRTVTILAYHAIAECPPADDPHALFMSPRDFERQMEFLARTRRVVPLQEAVEQPRASGKARVVITFDDGYRSLLEHALPVLEHHDLPATVFVPTAWIGDQNRWDQPSRCGLEIMSREEIEGAAARGLVFESHGHRHLDLTEATEVERRADLEQSAAVLTEITGRAPTCIAYPYGVSSEATEATVAELGFRAAFTLGFPHVSRFSWARIPIFRWDPRPLYRIQTLGGYVGLRYSSIGRAFATAYRSLRRGGPPARA